MLALLVVYRSFLLEFHTIDKVDEKKRALATYCCCENASKIVSDLHAMRHSDVTAGQRASGRTVQSPPVCKTILF